ncbi:MAG TPA: helix-turn-helix domain-containing protein [Conexibacter sp.]|nr:helix-turn-helix domain-containing protein [Conexibacter sp.]
MLEPLLPRLKRDIDARVAELRPLVEEAERLEAAKDALLAEAAAIGRAARRANGAQHVSNGFRDELRNGAASTPLAGTRGAAARNGSHRADDADERAPRGANQSAILAVVEERPGVSVAEISSVTKIAKPTVATTVSKLKRDGVLADEAGGVKLASRQPVTLSQIAPGGAGASRVAGRGGAKRSRDEGVSDEEWEAARRDPAAA